MHGPRLTEERLRHHLDSNQVMRERMCLALLPLLGPYTREQPRRPKGGPDGGRDLEAVYQGQTTVWGAVGFRNGGGLDEESRDGAEKKFRDDLVRALEENAALAGFVFFTNVDITPGRKENLLAYAQGKKVAFVEIFDMERLRHVLDSPEGLIARLQYLDIPMTVTEQAALVGKFGTQLQHAVTARFDRVEQTLAQMERFLQFQKPILRIDLYFEMVEATTSAAVGHEAVLLRIGGLHDISKTMSFFCTNCAGHQFAGSQLVSVAQVWNEESPSNILTLPPSIGSRTSMVLYNELSLSTAGNRVKIADLTILTFEAVCTEAIRDSVKRVAVVANGYELFSHVPDGRGEVNLPKIPDGVSFDTGGRKWVALVKLKEHNLFFNPPKTSESFAPLSRI